MESQATKTTLWQKAVAVCMSVVLVVGLSPAIPGAQTRAYADDLQAGKLTVQDAAADEAAAKAVDDAIETLQDKDHKATEAECAALRAAWNALTDAQKDLVENADYFDKDADASVDDALNSAPKANGNEILVVSFGTSFNGSRAADIGGIEKALQASYPDWSVRRAFTSQIIINHILARDAVKINRVDEALAAAKAAGVKNLVVAPTHLMKGIEYDEVKEAVDEFAKANASMTVTMSEPLLGSVGSTTTTVNSDKEVVAKAVTDAAVKDGNFSSRAAAAAAKTAFVFMGHGTSHNASITYDQMQSQMTALGYDNVFVGTVEGEPEDTAVDAVIAKVKAGGYENVILRPLMVVAGDHANNDMASADDPESWYSKFTAAGLKVTNQIAGLGQIEAVQNLYIAHVAKALPGVVEITNITNSAASGMFNAVSATVQTNADGSATLNMALNSTGYEYLIKGTKAEALALGDDPSKWIAGSKNAYGKMEFQIPLAAGEIDKAVPFISVSKSYYNKYKNNVDNTKLEDSFYARQLIVNPAHATLVTNDYQDVDKLIAVLQDKDTVATEEQCAAVRDAFNALTDKAKEALENADYFEADAPASDDNALNTAPDKKNEILVVSFGTSFNGSRAADIGGIEKALQAANPDWSVRRAFTSQIIINHILARDAVKINRVDEALAAAKAAGVKNLVVAPTHLMKGIEYNELKDAVDAFAKANPSMKVTMSEPLLGSVGSTATAVNSDKKAVAEAITAAALSDAKIADLDAAKAAKTAFVFMGHGTSHEASITYDQMQSQMTALGYDNVFIGTVEGEPEDTAVDAVIAKVKAGGYENVILRPLMVVAGDHANNDMASADDSESWYSKFTAAGLKVTNQIAGLGQIAKVQDIYKQHVSKVLPAVTPTPAKKAANTMTVKKATRSVSGITKKAKTVKGIVVKNAKGKVTYTKVKVNKLAKKFTVNKKTGAIKIAKGTKAGTYKVTVKATAAGNSKFKSASKKAVVTIKVKK